MTSINYKLEFEIEYISNHGKQVHLLSRCLVKKPTFTLTESSSLSNFLIRPIISQPRATDKFGNQRTDLFVFILCNRSDVAFIKVGDILELSDKSKNANPHL